MMLTEALSMMEKTYNDVKDICQSLHVELLPHLETYHAEALMSRKLIEVDLQELKPISILEIGAGTLELSLQLVREGFHLTAIEPSNIGFGFMARINTLYLQVLKNQKIDSSKLIFVNSMFEE